MKIIEFVIHVCVTDAEQPTAEQAATILARFLNAGGMPCTLHTRTCVERPETKAPPPNCPAPKGAN